jgi:hypothetical protein
MSSCPGPEFFIKPSWQIKARVRARPPDARRPAGSRLPTLSPSVPPLLSRYGPSVPPNPIRLCYDLQAVGSYGGPAPGDDAAAAPLPSRFPLGCFPSGGGGARVRRPLRQGRNTVSGWGWGGWIHGRSCKVDGIHGSSCQVVRIHGCSSNGGRIRHYLGTPKP